MGIYGFFLLPNHIVSDLDPFHGPRNVTLVGPDPVADDARADLAVACAQDGGNMGYLESAGLPLAYSPAQMTERP